MKLAIPTLACTLLLAVPTIASANADDVAWIKRCIADNADEGQSADTLAVYCSCMNNKMSSDETLSITAWEKRHPEEQEACSRKARWRSR
ncbi:hypothetical protein [Methylobacterium sp. P5_C11]